jgi:hypothetical protein
MGDWFQELVAGPTLRSTVNGRTFGIGTLETPSVAELRARAAACVDQLRGTASVTTVVGEAGALHRDALRDLLRIGVQGHVEVTSSASRGVHVSQVFCSALPLGVYADVGPELAAPFATLILDGAYEATLWAAVINAARTGNRTVFLTMVGGGVFGNDHAWIQSAIARALHLLEATSLDVRLVRHG